MPPTASNPGFVTGYSITYDEYGLPESGVKVYISVTRLASTVSSMIADTSWRESVSDELGLLEFTNLVPGATYMLTRGFACQRDNSVLMTVPTVATDPYLLPVFIGSDV